MELLSLIQPPFPASGEISFALGEQEGKLEEATNQFQAAMQRMLRLVAHFAWVETQSQGALLGRTIVTWTGDMDTLWGAGLSSGQFELHERSLQAALASRNTLLRTWLVTSQAAIKLSILVSTPGGAILALPAAWRLVNQILAQARQLRDQTHPTGE
jgi:hypothetical protein